VSTGDSCETLPRRNLPGRDYGLSVDQALAVEKITTSGRVLDVSRGGRPGSGEVNHHGGSQGRLGRQSTDPGR